MTASNEGPPTAGVRFLLRTGELMRSVGAAALALVTAVGVCMGQDASPGATDQERWDRRFEGSGFLYGKEPARILRENAELLPESGRALDVAAGEGRNAVFLALQGLDVDAIDISPVGLAKARRLAEERGVVINPIVADLTEYSFPREQYDVVVVTNYLQRDLMDDLEACLKPGGLIIYETYTTDQLEIPGAHRLRREFLLEPGELRGFFADLAILVYRESVDDTRAVASLIARKPLTR